jgi:hypothetical protein
MAACNVPIGICYKHFNNICGVIARTLKKKTRKETNLKFYKIMAVPVLFYGSKTWTLRRRDWYRIPSGRDEIFKNS